MLKRLTTTLAAFGALGALALGGSVIASAKQPAAHAKAHAKAHATHLSSTRADTADTPAEAPSTGVDPAGGANVQSGDQSAPDTGSATPAQSGSENGGEAPSSEADGPGGHQDPPGANVDVQQQGQN